MASTEATHIDSTLTESRKFPPPAEFSAKAWVKNFDEYTALCKRADTDPDAFWAECARNLHWFKPFGKTLEWNFPNAKWFVGGKINASYNCLDRHLDTSRRNKAALIWEGEPGDSRVLTYQMLAARFANAPTCSRAWASRTATASRFTCRWCRKRRSRCSPARASARCIR